MNIGDNRIKLANTCNMHPTFQFRCHAEPTDIKVNSVGPWKCEASRYHCECHYESSSAKLTIPAQIDLRWPKPSRESFHWKDFAKIFTRSMVS